MAKKTTTEYEAMIGGLMRRIESLEENNSYALFNWKEWMERAKKAENRVAFLSGEVPPHDV